MKEASPKGQKGGKDHEESTLQRLSEIGQNLGFAGMIDEGIKILVDFGSMLIRKIRNFYPFFG